MGYLTISILDKTHLTSNSDSFGSEGSVASRARAVLFVGVALLAGGFAGSLVSPPPYPAEECLVERCLAESETGWSGGGRRY